MNQEPNMGEQTTANSPSQELFHKHVTSAEARLDPLLSQQIIEGYPDCIKLLDYSGKLLYMNQSGLRCIENNDFASRQFTEWTALWSGEGRDLAEKALASARIGQMATFDAEGFNTQDTRKWWEVTVLPIVDTQGQISHLLTIARDITQRKLEQMALIEQVRQDAQQREDFLSMAAHELKTPLTALQGNVQLAQRHIHKILAQADALRPAQQTFLTQAVQLLKRSQENVKMQNRLINDLLDMSRAQAGKLELQRQPSDLITLVQETIQDQQSASSLRTIKLDLAEQAPIMVLVDPERIKQVIINYVTNALKYSAMDQPVHVGVSSDNMYARVWVQDQGIGLTQKQQTHIWERFYQTQEMTVSSAGSPGLGLGLYICQVLIQAHEGEVGVESTKGVGSTFWFTLPILQLHDQTGNQGHS